MSENNYSIEKVIKETLKTEERLPLETTVKTFPKGAVILSPAIMFPNNIYVISGILQLSVRTKDDQERIMEFIFPNEFFGVYTFFGDLPKRRYYLTCLTDCTLELMPMQEYYLKLNDSLVLNKLSRLVLEMWLVKRLKREIDMLSKTAEERYLDLMANRPDVLRQIPISKIAKYLGIHPDSLSRIRRKKIF